MFANKNIFKSLLFVMAGVIPIVVVKVYPVVDWVSEPLLIYLFMLPLLLIEVVLFLILLKIKKSKTILIIQIILIVFLYSLMMHYIRVH